MKLMTLLLMTSLLQISLASVAQNINLNKKNTPLEQIFKSIESQTGYQFLYFEKMLDDSKKVSVNVRKASLSTVLDLCFKDQPLTYAIKGRTIIVQPKVFEKIIVSPVQLSTITGRVLDETGSGLPGVTVKATKSKNTTTTDTNGSFSITAEPDEDLQFSFVGYIPIFRRAGVSTVLNVKMSPESKSLTDVVVIGYGAVKKANLTGSIATVKGSDLNQSTASNFGQALQGKAAGVQVIQKTGQPGASAAIQIRSNPSFANAGVLYVIDGIPVNDNAGTPSGSTRYGSGNVDQSPLNFINPNDIETIDFLKDASSAAIYGARAGAGVVLITTKRGKQGLPKITYSGSHGIQKVDKMYDVLNTRDYMIQRNLMAQEQYMLRNKIAPYYGTVNSTSVPAFTPIYSQSELDTTQAYPSAMDAITRKGYTAQHNLSMSGGNESTSYFISGNFFDQKGTIIGTGYKRYNGRLNLDQKISKKIKVGISLIGSNSLANNTITGGENENGGIVTAALYYPANLPLRRVGGSYPIDPYYPNIPNPLSYETITDNTNSYRLLSSGYLEWEIIKNLKAKANLSYDQSNAKRNNYLPTSFLYGANVNGAASINENSSNSTLSEYTLSYNKVLGEKQSINAVIGTSFQRTNWASLGANNQSFFSDVLNTYSLQAGQSPSPGVSSGKASETWGSYFGRVMYQYDSKYTIQASLRADGSSKFAANEKWGYFPSVSAGWILSSEAFMRALPVVSYAKIRAGYGETGNSSFPGSAYQLYASNNLNPNFGTGQVATGVNLAQEGNPNLTWESAGEINAGLDFGLFTNRISGSFDYFSKKIRNLISYIPYPSDWIVSGIYGNAGTTKSVGYDIGLQTKNVVSTDKRGFTWSSNFTFSHYLNYWVKRSDNALATLPRYQIASGKNALFNGIYGYITDGFFSGTYGSSPTVMPGMIPGGLVVRDIQGYDAQGQLTGPDGTITAADQTLIGNADPKFNFGFGNTFTFKNFDLNVFVSGIKQKKWSVYAKNFSGTTTFAFNTFNSIQDRWTFQNPGSTYPTGLIDPNYSTFQGMSTYWLQDASFIRFRNITLGYTINQQYLKWTKAISSLRIFFDGQNLFTITNYKGLDPEINSGNFYPLTKTYLIGINASF